MRRFAVIIFLMLTVTTAVISAQTSLDSLWPNDDGIRFDYDYECTDTRWHMTFGGPAHLALSGSVMTAGGEAQILEGEHPQWPDKEVGAPSNLPPLLAAIWRGRPDLREAIEMKTSGATKSIYWSPLFLHEGYFMKSADKIEMWQQSADHSTWTYIAGDPAYGASFSKPLIPELAEGIVLHGTVTSLAATVETISGTLIPPS